MIASITLNLPDGLEVDTAIEVKGFKSLRKRLKSLAEDNPTWTSMVVTIEKETTDE